MLETILLGLGFTAGGTIALMNDAVLIGFILIAIAIVIMAMNPPDD